MKLRVVHCGTGVSGKHAARAILAQPHLELVGMRVYDPRKAGRDAGELVGSPPTGVTATQDMDALLALEPDCLTYFGDPFTHPKPGIEDVTCFLARGTDVVTPTFMPLLHPPSAPAELREPVERACRQGGSSFYCSGIEPGFVDCQLAIDLLSMADQVSEIRVQEIGNYSKDLNVFAMQEIFGFGAPLDKATLLRTSSMGQFIWGACIRVIADALGRTVERIDAVCETAAFHRDLETASGPVPAGTIAAVRYEMSGVVAGQRLFVIEHVLRMHPDAAPQWEVAHGGQGAVPFHQHRVIITGRPSLSCSLDTAAGDETINHGFALVAMRLVNAIPIVHKAKTGILGQLEIARYSKHDWPIP